MYGSKSIATGEGAEQLLGDALTKSPIRPITSTKFFPVPWTTLVGVGGGVRLGRQAVIEALRRSLTRMGLASVDVLYLHFPSPLPGLYDGLADCVDAGLASAVGVSNHNVAQLKAAHAALAARGVRVVANQFRYHVLDRSAERSGLLEETLALGVTPVAYEPLAGGLLTGKYTDGEVSPGRKYTTAQLKLYKQLTNLMRFMGATCGGQPRSNTEVALAYCVAKGIVPIPGVKTEGQARDVVRALNFSLDQDVVEVLTEKSDYILAQRA